MVRVRQVVTKKTSRIWYWKTAAGKLKKQWAAVLLNTRVFLLITWLINFLIDLLAYQTCLYLTLKSDGILAASASEWTILLFFKNLSVIPFTLVFDAVFLLWIADRLQSRIPGFNTQQ